MNKKTIFMVILALLFIVIYAAACTPKYAGQWDPGISYNIGNLPQDACIVNGQPLILNANTESDGGFSLVYVRNNGDIVIKAWLPDPVLGTGLFPAGEYYFSGGNCPSKG